MWHLRRGANYMLCLSISWMEFHADQMLSIGILPVACTWCTDSIWLVDVFRQGRFYISNMWNLGRIWLFKQLQQLPMSWQVKRIPMKTHFHHIPSSRFLGFPDHIWGGSGQKVRRRYLICWHVNVLKLGVLSMYEVRAGSTLQSGVTATSCITGIRLPFNKNYIF